MGLTNCPDCKGKVSDSATACPHCGRPMKKPEIKTDPLLSQASSAGKIHCSDCKGYVNPKKQSGRKSNLYLRADLPGNFDPMIRMPDGPDENYCPICNKRLHGQPESYGSGSSRTVQTPAQEKAENFGYIVWATIAIMILVGGWGTFSGEGTVHLDKDASGFVWLLVIGVIAFVLWASFSDYWIGLVEKEGNAKAKTAAKAKARAAKAKARAAEVKTADLLERRKLLQAKMAARAKAKAAEAKAVKIEPVISYIYLAIEAAIRKEVRKPTGELTKAVLEKVTRLPFSRTNITDVDLKELAKLKNLTRLYLNRTQITDKGLKELAKLENLTHLNLKSTNITDAGLAELKKALPKCQIKHSLKK